MVHQAPPDANSYLCDYPLMHLPRPEKSLTQIPYLVSQIMWPFCDRYQNTEMLNKETGLQNLDIIPLLCNINHT